MGREGNEQFLEEEKVRHTRSSVLQGEVVLVIIEVNNGNDLVWLGQLRERPRGTLYTPCLLWFLWRSQLLPSLAVVGKNKLKNSLPFQALSSPTP